ncbi:MAG: hypothetical protein KatS3mg082_1821 [Nitrospiraceae bacterium]|nr:MAG: hypothetical protein KatS3mg082_1821 [Nitrospiraceae bacterium]
MTTTILYRGWALLFGFELWALASPLAAADRFTMVFNGEAVKDNQTGLIWEREPDREFDVWSASISRCETKTVGGQTGWRAPTVEELKTLVDPSQKDPALLPGHPFVNIKSAIYWTATPSPTDEIVAWQVSFFSGEAVTDQKVRHAPRLVRTRRAAEVIGALPPV